VFGRFVQKQANNDIHTLLIFIYLFNISFSLSLTLIIISENVTETCKQTNNDIYTLLIFLHLFNITFSLYLSYHRIVSLTYYIIFFIPFSLKVKYRYGYPWNIFQNKMLGRQTRKKRMSELLPRLETVRFKERWPIKTKIKVFRTTDLIIMWMKTIDSFLLQNLNSQQRVFQLLQTSFNNYTMNLFNLIYLGFPSS